MRLFLWSLVALACLVALRSSHPVTAQTGEAWTIYTNTNAVNAVAVSGNILWIATEGGVVRWDTSTGEHRTFTIDDGLPSNQARAILYNPNTLHLWVGTLQGLARWDGTQWRVWTVLDGLAADRVDGLAQDAAGRIWATTSATATVWDGVTMRKFTNMFEAISFYYNDVRQSTHLTTVWAIEGGTTIWTTIGPSDGVHRYNGASWTTYTTANLPGLPSDLVDAVIVTPDGSRWFGTGRGVVRWRPDGDATRIGGTQVPLVRVRALQADASGRVLVGYFGCDVTCVGGMARIDDRGTASEADDIITTYYAQPNGLPDSEINALVRGVAGEMWIGTKGGLTSLNSDDSMGPQLSASSLPSNQVNTLYRDLSGMLWVGTSNGLGVYDTLTREWTVYNTQNSGLPSNWVTAILGVGQEIWVATGENRSTGPAGGVSRRLADGQWVHYIQAGSAGDTRGNVRALAYEPVPLVGSGYRIWAGTSGMGSSPPKLFVYDTNGQWSSWVSGENGTFGSIRSLSVRLNKVWLATQAEGSYPGGLTVLDHGGAPSSGASNWTTYTAANTGGNLLSDFTTAVAADRVGRVWIGTPLGVSVYETVPNTWKQYTVGNSNGGLINNFINKIHFSDDTSGNSSQVWFMTQGGASRLDTQFNQWRTWNRGNGDTGAHNFTSMVSEVSCRRWFGTGEGLAFVAYDQCNMTGPTPTPFPTKTRTPAPTGTPTETPTPTETLTPSLTPPATTTRTITPTGTRVVVTLPPMTLPATASPTLVQPSVTPTPTLPSIDPTHTPTPTRTPTSVVTPTPTMTGGPPIHVQFLPWIAGGVKGPPPVQ